MSGFSVATRNAMLDSQTFDHVHLHNGDPGSDGTANQVGSAESVTFSSASGGGRALSEEQLFTDLGDGTPISWFSAWEGDPAETGTFRGKGEVAGAEAANSEGEYKLTTETELRIDDPA